MNPDIDAIRYVRLIDVLTINEETKNEDEVLEIVKQASKYFPKGIWEGVEYLGNLDMEHDLKITSNKKVCGAFIFEKVVSKIRKLKGKFKTFKLLLGITSDPIVSIYYRFEFGTYYRMVNLVHDYVSEDIGVVSLFEIKDDSASNLVAHGLGHNKGLKHHINPIDVMYIDLLNHPMLSKKPFCIECTSKLKNLQ